MGLENSLQIDFQLLGTAVPPKEITRRTQITPDVELMQGERNQKLNLPRLNIWSIRSRVKSDVLADHWHELEHILTDSKEVIREIALTGRAKITVVIQCGQRIPSIIIPPSMSSFAGYVNAIIDIDHLQ